MRRFLPAGLFLVAATAICLMDLPSLPAQPKSAPPAIPPSYPTLTNPMNQGAKPGTTIDLVLTGTNLVDATEVWTSFNGKVTLPPMAKDAAKLPVKLEIPADARPGLHFVRVATKAGVSNLRPLSLDELPEVAETDKNRDKKAPQPIPNPCVVTGTATTEAADFFKVPVAAGEPLTVEVLARRLGSPLDPVVILSDASGKELGGVYADDTPGLQGDSRITYLPKAAGEIIIEVRDTTYRGGADFAYRLRVGNFPGVTTAFPLAVERGKAASIGFSGPQIEGINPVNVTAPTDPAIQALYVTPKRAKGPAGTPVPVKISDFPEIVEQEPNDDPAKANKISAPGGISARFDKKNDVDHFKFTATKGVKYIIQTETYEVNAPTEVYLKVLDAKGGEMTKSNPTQPTARAEVTATVDGELVIACEHLNYLSGPNEVYHLTVTPATPDFAVTVGLDRIDVPAGGVGLVPITGLTKLNGFAGPVEISITGDGITGSRIIPAASNPQPVATEFIPISATAAAKPGLRMVQVKATAKIDGKDVVRFGTVADTIRASMAGLPNVPAESTTRLAIAVTSAPAFALDLTFEKPEVVVGGSLKGKIAVKRSKDFAEDVQIAQVLVPANVTLKLVPVAKGKDDAVVELTAPANVAVGPGMILVRGTGKVAGKDVAVLAPPVTVDFKAAPKKEEPKKEPPKKP